MLKQISEKEFLCRANSYVHQIEIDDSCWLLDDNLLDCAGIVVSFSDKKYFITGEEADDDFGQFIYYEYSDSEIELFPKKIISTEEERILFINFQKDIGGPELRFHIGNRPILVTAKADCLAVGISHYDVDGEWLEFDNNVLLNG